ncbi:hypothetical protein DFR50_107170 [Roseiarcus fermentans]|uniref:Uncharacterized protein n=1 Tax=Roseiarcus fermentans TaxID=1473586 RepID=A0A366FPB9_9HYPH|nr:hypothetical protein DFR50_107170 [Roseiarcus fermentans]
MKRCPVCGYDGLEEPAYDDVGAPSYEICPCCGIEFGYEDASRSHESLREEWIAKGMPWWADDKPPPGWDPVQQVRSLTEGPGIDGATITPPIDEVGTVDYKSGRQRR